MDSNSINQIILALKPLADKFGQGAQQFFQLAIRQVYIDSLESLIWLVPLVYALAKCYEWAKREELDEVLRFFAGFGVVLSVILVCVCVCCCIDGLANPNYQAISNIMNMVVPKTK